MGSNGLFSLLPFPDSAAAEVISAAEVGSLQRVSELLNAGVSAACTDANGHTPLHKCAFMGFDAVAQVLIAAEPSMVDAQDLMLNTPLHAAAFSGHARMNHLLLTARADINAADLAGNTPLHRATLEGNIEVAAILLERGADANALGSERSTPLHFTALGASDGACQMAELLLRGGALPGERNRFGKTAHDLAIFQGHRALAKQLAAAACTAAPSIPAASADSAAAATTAPRSSRFKLQTGGDATTAEAVGGVASAWREERGGASDACEGLGGGVHSGRSGEGSASGHRASRQLSGQMPVDLFAKVMEVSRVV